MHRFLIILSLLPILAALMCRKFFADRVLNTSDQNKLRDSSHDFIRKALNSMHHEDIEIKTKKPSWSGSYVVRKNSLTLSPKIAMGSSVLEHGQAALDFGLFLLSRRSPEIIARRQWAIRFGHVFPIFTTVVAIFALLVAKLHFGWLLAIIVTSLGIASCAQILTLMANLQAADLASIVLEKKRIFPRLQDEEAVIKATKAWAWHGILPGLLSRII